MNASTSPGHLAPEVHPRAVPAALLDALKSRFGERCSTALVVREQHGRDESAYAPIAPPSAVVFAHSITAAIPIQSTLAQDPSVTCRTGAPVRFKESSKKPGCPAEECGRQAADTGFKRKLKAVHTPKISSTMRLNISHDQPETPSTMG